MGTTRSAKEKVIVFPDTNIFLHFLPLNDLDLTSIFGFDEITLAICPQIIDELDEVKWSHSRRGIRNRASDSLGRIKKWAQDPSLIRKGVNFKLADRAELETISKYELNERSGDDMLMAAILQHRKQEPTAIHYLLSNDVGAQLRAASKGIEILELNPVHMLPAVQDDQQKEIQRLQNELVRLQSRLPSLKLLYQDDSEDISIEFSGQLQFLPSAAEGKANKKVDEVRARFNPPEDQTSDSNSEFAKTLNQLMAYSQEEIQRFENDLKLYKELYEKFLKEVNEIDNWNLRSVALYFSLVNSGTAMAEDIIIRLTLPEYLQWNTQEGRAKYPKPPNPPDIPRPRFLQSTVRDYGSSMALPLLDIEEQTPSKEPNPKFTFGNRTVTIELVKLHHGDRWLFRPLTATFIKAENIKPFQITFTVQDKNSPEIVEGRLLVKIKQAK